MHVRECVHVRMFAHHVSLPQVQLCIAKVSTGYPCPGCGMTRAVVNLGNGEMLESLRFHPLGVVLVGATVAGLAGAVIGLVRGRDPVWAFLDRHGPWVMVSFLVALFAVWIVRTWVVPDWAPDPIGKPTNAVIWAFER